VFSVILAEFHIIVQRMDTSQLLLMGKKQTILPFFALLEFE